MRAIKDTFADNVPLIGQPKCFCGQPAHGLLNGEQVCMGHFQAAVTVMAANVAKHNCPVKLKVRRLREDATLPKYAHPGEDAGLDLCSCSEIALSPGSFSYIPCGIAIELWPGCEAQVRSRSGMAAKHGVFVLNSPGTIDSGYRGEIGVVLFNAGPEIVKIDKGDKIAQLVIARFEYVKVEMADELDETSRGANGMGSTGV